MSRIFVSAFLSQVTRVQDFIGYCVVWYGGCRARLLYHFSRQCESLEHSATSNERRILIWIWGFVINLHVCMAHILTTVQYRQGSPSDFAM